MTDFLGGIASGIAAVFSLGARTSEQDEMEAAYAREAMALGESMRQEALEEIALPSRPSPMRLMAQALTSHGPAAPSWDLPAVYRPSDPSVVLVKFISDDAYLVHREFHRLFVARFSALLEQQQRAVDDAQAGRRPPVDVPFRLDFEDIWTVDPSETEAYERDEHTACYAMEKRVLEAARAQASNGGRLFPSQWMLYVRGASPLFTKIRTHFTNPRHMFDYERDGASTDELGMRRLPFAIVAFICGHVPQFVAQASLKGTTQPASPPDFHIVHATEGGLSSSPSANPWPRVCETLSTPFRVQNDWLAMPSWMLTLDDPDQPLPLAPIGDARTWETLDRAAQALSAELVRAAQTLQAIDHETRRKLELIRVHLQGAEAFLRALTADTPPAGGSSDAGTD